MANGQGDVVRFPARVDVVEYLGNEELIHAQAEGSEIVALIPSDRKVEARASRSSWACRSTSCTSSTRRRSSH